MFQKRGLVLRDFLLQMSLRCYYQVLDVAQDVEQDEIRKAYRRQALLWHPGEDPVQQGSAVNDRNCRFHALPRRGGGGLHGIGQRFAAIRCIWSHT